MKKIKEMFKKMWNFAFHTEAGLYLVFGVLTTVVSYSIYSISVLILDNYLEEKVYVTITKVFSNIVGILFAYFTNVSIVFRSEAKGKKKFYEFLKFVGSRLFTLVLDALLTSMLTLKLGWHPLVSGGISNVVVVILNYVLSKVFVFVKK